VDEHKHLKQNEIELSESSATSLDSLDSQNSSHSSMVVQKNQPFLARLLYSKTSLRKSPSRLGPSINSSRRGSGNLVNAENGTDSLDAVDFRGSGKITRRQSETDSVIKSVRCC
jgi:hypothetical protein